MPEIVLNYLIYMCAYGIGFFLSNKYLVFVPCTFIYVQFHNFLILVFLCLVIFPFPPHHLSCFFCFVIPPYVIAYSYLFCLYVSLAYLAAVSIESASCLFSCSLFIILVMLNFAISASNLAQSVLVKSYFVCCVYFCFVAISYIM